MAEQTKHRIPEDRLLTANQTREFFGGVSDMWLHRRLHEPVNFPEPIRISGRRFWRLSELRNWIAERQQDAA